MAPHHGEVLSPVGTVWFLQGRLGAGGGQEAHEGRAPNGLLPAEFASGPLAGA